MTQQEFRKRYEFDLKTDNIGGGSFGTVYRAYDNALDREVAIKVSEVKIVGDKEFSLLEEFKAIENLSAHQNIANYEEVFRFESFPTVFDYGIMQYYSLGNLSHYLKNNEVTLVDREKITRGVLEGIAFLHQHNVVHRDLKPSNILVVDRRGEIIPKITDFGLSKQAEGDGKASRFTNSFAGGTLQYSSPEQLKGLPLKLNTDLWSFGAIAYEILTGKTLFEADSQGTATAEWQNEITQKILHKDLSEELNLVSERWQRAIAACLERDLTKRIKTSDDLFAILNNEKIAENIVVAAPIANNDATIIKSKEPKKVIPSKKVEIPKKEVVSNQQTIQKTEPIPKKEQPKWIIPAIVGATVLNLVIVGYFMFSSDDVKPVETKLSVFKEGNLYGYKEGENIIIAPKYLEAKAFVNDSAKVAVRDSSFVINKKGEWLATLTDSIQYKKNLLNAEKQELANADKKAWQRATRNNTVSAYNSYIKEFKNGKYTAQAKSNIDKLEVPKSTIAIPNKILDYKEIQAWKAIEGNVEKTRIAAVNGNTNAMVLMGLMEESTPKQIEWYEKAANRGNANAQFKLTEIFSSISGHRDGDFDDAVKFRKWLTKAVNQNQPDAIYQMGSALKYGIDGFDKNFRKAIEYYKKAISKNKHVSLSYSSIIDCYEELGEYDNAIIWRQKIIDKYGRNNKESFYSQLKIAEYYFEGKGVNKNYIEAAKRFKYVFDNSAKEHWYNTKPNLGMIYFDGGYGVDRNYNLAYKYFKEAACEGCEKPSYIRDDVSVGSHEAQHMLGLMYEKGYAVAKNMDEAIRYYKLSAMDNMILKASKGKQALRRLGLY